MRWIVAAAVGGALAWGCGGGGSAADPEALVQAAVDAVIEPGMVFHAKSDEGSEVWIDGERELYRVQSGEKGDRSFHMRVGEGWRLWSFWGSDNEVTEEEVEPPVEYLSRVDNPAVVAGLAALGILVTWENAEVAGEKEWEGRDVVVVESRPIIEEIDLPEGATLVFAVELDRKSHLVVATESRLIPPEGEGEDEEDNPTIERVVYATEFIPREELPEDFFSPEVLYDAVITFEERLEAVRALGVTPYWLGERFEAREGDLILPDVWDVHAYENRGEATLSYWTSGPSGAVGNAALITLRPAGATFTPPEVPSLGLGPELEEQVTVQEQDAILYTSELQPGGVPCTVGEPCILPDVPFYSRLVVTLGDTAIEVKAPSWPEAGAGRNPFNNREAILALARALEPAE
jgi:hypothetical protein